MKYKEELVKRFNENLFKAVKADLDGKSREADFAFGCASGMLSASYCMYDTVGTELMAKMSCAMDLAYDIVSNEVDDIQESLWILKNNMA